MKVVRWIQSILITHLLRHPDLHKLLAFDCVEVVPLCTEKERMTNDNWLDHSDLNSSVIKYAKSGRACRTEDISGGMIRSFSSRSFEPLINKSSSVSCCICTFKSNENVLINFQQKQVYTIWCCLRIGIKIQIIVGGYTGGIVCSCCID